MTKAIAVDDLEQGLAHEAVRARYSAAAQEREGALCCPVDYDPRLLDAIPQEVIDRDYGCGDPSRYVRAGDTVLDLGSGGGKICFMASQIVGAKGRVIGVDANEDMLDLARRSAPAVADQVGYANVEFRRGHIEDLALDTDRLNEWLKDNPVSDHMGLDRLDTERARLREREPLIPDEYVDIVVSNCVLNLVRESEKRTLIDEIFRVLRPGGRIAISDIVSDEHVPPTLRADPELFSGCVSGAFHELALLRELERVGFYGIAIDRWESEPFAIVDGIEFRSVTLVARKGKQGPCLEANQALIYAGPWKRVEDDDGHVFERGERVAVCAKTFRLLTNEPYVDALIPIEPRIAVPEHRREEFDCHRKTLRHPRETKGEEFFETREPGAGGSCCE